MSLNAIIEHIKGEYLIFLSTDYYFYDNDVVTNYVSEFINDKSIDYVYGNIQIVDNEGENKGALRYKNYSDNEIIYNTLKNMGSGVIPLFTGMFKTDFYYKYKFIDDHSNRVVGDTLNTLIYTKYKWKRKYKDFYTFCYRQHDNNMIYDIKRRIKSIISVMEYAVSNFDIEILLPEIQWEKYDGDIKEAIQMYLIGDYYWKALSVYYNGEVKIFENEIELDKEQLREYVQPLIPVIEKYLKKSICKNLHFSEEIKSILTKINAIKMQSIHISNHSMKDEIYIEGQNLRNSLLSVYKDKYYDENLKVLIYAPKNGAWIYGFNSWKDILEYMGIKVIIFDDIKDITLSSNFDIFINIAEKSYIENISKIKCISEIPYKVGIASKQDYFTSSNCTEQDLENINSIADFNYDFLISSFSQNSINTVFKSWIDQNIKIQSIPFGFNPLIHYPEKAVEKYDYFFVGTNSYRKIKETNEYLLPIISKYKGILRGVNWNDSIPQLHPKNNGFFYNRAKINLNYHLQSQKQYENEINERTFVICACGGFQLVDNPKIIDKYYNGKEIAIANDEKDYLEKFSYYLNNPLERNDMSYKALIKTYDNNCSLFHRIEEILKILYKK